MGSSSSADMPQPRRVVRAAPRRHPGRPLRRLAVSAGPSTHVRLRRQVGRRLRLRLRRHVRPLGARRGRPGDARRRRARAGSEGGSPASPRSRASLPDALASSTARLARRRALLSVLEHLWEPRETAARAAAGHRARRGLPRQRPELARASGSSSSPRSGSASARPRRWTTTSATTTRATSGRSLVRGRFQPQRHSVPPPQVRPQHLRRVPSDREARAPMMSFAEHVPRRDRRIVEQLDARRGRAGRRGSRGGPRRAADGSSCSASAAPPRTPATP